MSKRRDKNIRFTKNIIFKGLFIFPWYNLQTTGGKFTNLMDVINLVTFDNTLRKFTYEYHNPHQKLSEYYHSDFHQVLGHTRPLKLGEAERTIFYGTQTNYTTHVISRKEMNTRLRHVKHHN